MDLASFALITGQLRISVVGRCTADVNQQSWPYTALIWPPASIRAVPAGKQEVTLSALLKICLLLAGGSLLQSSEIQRSPQD